MQWMIKKGVSGIFKGKVILNALYISSLFALISIIPLSCQMVSNSVNQLTGDRYYASAISFVRDKDLNIANNLTKEAAWGLTQTRNVSGKPDPIAGLPWIPFQFYAENFLGSLGLKPTNCLISNAQIAHVIGNIFYLFILFALLFWLLKNLGFNHNLKLIFGLSFFGTPLIFFSIIESTGNLLLILVLLVLQVCLMSEQAAGRKEILKWLLVGAIGGLAVAFEKYIFYFTIAPIIFVLLREPVNRKTFFWIGLVTIGGLSVYVIDLSNYGLKYGHINKPFFSSDFLKTSNLFIEEPNAKTRSFFGPNGIFFLFPIYAISFLGISKFIVDIIERAKRLSVNEALIISISATSLISMFCNPGIYFLKEQIGSGHFLSQQMLFTFGMVLFFTYITERQKKLLKPVLYILSMWSFFWIIAYMHRDPLFGIVYKNLNFKYIADVVSFFKNEILNVFFQINLLKLALEIILLWFPLALIGMVFFQWMKNKNYSSRIAIGIFLLIGFLGVTVVNRIYQRENTIRSAQQGIFIQRLMAQSYLLAAYDEYMGTLEYLQRYFEVHNLYDAHKRLELSRMAWAKKLSHDVIRDGINFKNNLDKGIVKPAFKGIRSAHEAGKTIDCPITE